MVIAQDHNEHVLIEVMSLFPQCSVFYVHTDPQNIFQNCTLEGIVQNLSNSIHIPVDKDLRVLYLTYFNFDCCSFSANL